MNFNEAIEAAHCTSNYAIFLMNNNLWNDNHSHPIASFHSVEKTNQEPHICQIWRNDEYLIKNTIQYTKLIK